MSTFGLSNDELDREQVIDKIDFFEIVNPNLQLVLEVHQPVGHLFLARWPVYRQNRTKQTGPGKW